MTDEMILSGTLTVLFKVVIPYHVYNTLNIEHKKWKKFHYAHVLSPYITI